ncbi:PKD domain-containing protein, partial [Zhouia amylolytica]|uniref:PKD domain-containing protein n=1 Tax=Zhouia amylolytica TaxID=376730 RepID=UPI0023B10B30
MKKFLLSKMPKYKAVNKLFVLALMLLVNIRNKGKLAFTILFLFIGITNANADCTINTAATGGDNIMTGSELLAYITANNCSGTLTIEAPVDIILSTDLTITSDITKIVIKDGGQILWDSNNVDLFLAGGTSIDIENTTNLGSIDGALGSTSSTCSNNRAIYIGSIKYSACEGGGNVCLTYDDLIEAGGTPSVDPFVAVIGGTDNDVCFDTTYLDVTIGNLPDGIIVDSYEWTLASGDGTATFSDPNAEDTNVTVSDPGTYTFRLTVKIPLGADGTNCDGSFVTVFTDIELDFLDSPVASIDSATPDSCELTYNFSGSSTDPSGGNDILYEWDFGDGTTSSEQNPTHNYSSCGEYTVTLTSTDPGSLLECRTSTVTQVINVQDTKLPTFTAPADIEIFTDASCNYDASVAQTGDVTNEADNCSTGLNATFSDVISPGSCEGSFVITRTWSLSDNCGNDAADQVQTITVS